MRHADNKSKHGPAKTQVRGTRDGRRQMGRMITIKGV
jgi:hypothetical protein